MRRNDVRGTCRAPSTGRPHATPPASRERPKSGVAEPVPSSIAPAPIRKGSCPDSTPARSRPVFRIAHLASSSAPGSDARAEAEVGSPPCRAVTRCGEMAAPSRDPRLRRACGGDASYRRRLRPEVWTLPSYSLPGGDASVRGAAPFETGVVVARQKGSCMNTNIRHAHRSVISAWEDDGGSLDRTHDSDARGEHRYPDLHQTSAERKARQERDDLKRALAGRRIPPPVRRGARP